MNNSKKKGTYKYLMLNGGIYQIKNIVNGKVYVGSAKDFDERWGSHLYDLRRGTHINPHLQRSFSKHGEQNFEFGVVEILGKYDKEVYFAHENIYINQAKATGLCYNIAKAEGGWTYHTRERKEDIAAKVSKGMKSHLASLSPEERREKYGWSIGIPRTAEEKQKISKKLKGIPKTDETRKRMSEAAMGKSRQYMIENGRKIGLSNKGKPANNRRKVIVNDQTFDSLKEAAMFLKTCSSVLCTAIKRDKKFRKVYNVRYE